MVKIILIIIHKEIRTLLMGLAGAKQNLGLAE